LLVGSLRPKHQTAVLKKQNRRFLFEKSDCGGVLKSPFFKDMAVSRRYRHVLLYLP